MSERADKIKEYHKKYNLQSWSKQKDINPIPIEKAEGIYMWDFDGNDRRRGKRIWYSGN